MRRAAILLATLLFAPAVGAQGEPKAPIDSLRDRAREATEKYNAGAYAEAIVIWEEIYRVLGPSAGYRLAFNIGRAYEQFGDLTRAAENYEAYVLQTDRRRAAGETLEPNVEKQEEEAKARLAELAATKGRLHIASDRSVSVSIDGGTAQLVTREGFVRYVAPGKHVVVFDQEPPTTVDVAAGTVLDVSPPPVAGMEVPPPPPAPPRYEMRRTEPFSDAWLIGGAALTVASVALPIVFYNKAQNTKDDYADANSAQVEDARKRSLASDYDGERTAAYVTLAIPIALGVATAALAAYWFAKSRTERVRVGTGSTLLRF